MDQKKFKEATVLSLMVFGIVFAMQRNVLTAIFVGLLAWAAVYLALILRRAK